MRPWFDKRDAAILEERAALLAANPINVGDFVRFADGIARRVSYIMTESGDDVANSKPEWIQTSDSGSFYLGDGYVSFSGSLYVGVPFASLVDTGDTFDGRVWFFHHDFAMADNGVECSTKFRIWRCDRVAERS